MHRRLLLLTRDSRLPLAFTVLSGLAVGLLTIWQAWLLSRVINAVFLEEQSLEQVWRLLLLVLAAIGGRGLLTSVNEISSSAVAIKIKTDLCQRLFAHILRLGPAYARGQRTGELTAAAVEGIEALDAYFSQYLPQLLITALVPLAILSVVFPIDILSGFIFLVTAPLIPFFMIMIGKGAELVTRRQYDTLRLLSAHFLDSLQGLTTLKLFGQSRAQGRNIARVSDKYRDTTLGVLRVTFLSALALELLATLSTAIIAVEIGFRLLYARMDFQPALFLLVLAPEFYMPLRALGARFHAGMSGTIAAKRIYEILDTPLSGTRLSETGDPPAGEIASIVLETVSFTYPGEITPALENIGLTIPKGQHLAVVGKTGAGKSTLVHLLLGFIQPTAGRVITAPRTPDPPSMIRHGSAWVPQKPHLFHDTIAANIRLGKADATGDEIMAAAKAAYLHEFIETLPQKYETVIGEGGARLSSGQAQRLALARAFLKNAPILILDEPTSSLDPETEAQLEMSTRTLMQGRTVITIAHRLNTAFQADHIVVLDSGRIVEQGTHPELLERHGLYASMVNSQVADNSFNVDRSWTPKTSQAGRAVPGSPAARMPPAPDHRPPVFLRLLAFLQGHWPRVVLSVLLGSLTIGSSVALMGTSAWLISTAALHPSVAELGVSVVGVRFFGIARGFFRYLERLVSHDVTFRLLARLRVWFYEKLEPLAPARLMDFRAGDLLARVIADVETLENFYVRVVSPPLTAVLVGLVTSIFLAAFYHLLAPVYLAFFTSLGLCLPVFVQTISRRAAVETVNSRAELHTHLVDSLQGMAELLAYGRGSERLHQLAANGDAAGRAQHRLGRVTAFHSGAATVLTNLGVWAILYLCIPQVSSGSLAGPMLAALALLTFASFEAVTPLPVAAQMWNSSREAARRLFQVVDTEPMVSENLPAPNNRQITSHELAFRNLSFAYPGQNTPALQNISFKLEPGRSVAIVGPSGAGKSTLASLLHRFWDYESGEIRLGAGPLKAYAPEAVRACIGLVSQNTYFFNATVGENLRFTRCKATRDQIEAAARAAQIHDFIMSLPKGYDTLIGEQGLRLSGGERQRLAIARVLVKNAPILILDEPTANLDPLTEQHVLRILFGVMKQKSTILITHRLIGLENVDEILVMDHGRIVERGTHLMLMEAGGLYRRLIDLQNRMLGHNF